MEELTISPPGDFVLEYTVVPRSTVKENLFRNRFLGIGDFNGSRLCFGIPAADAAFHVEL